MGNVSTMSDITLDTAKYLKKATQRYSVTLSDAGLMAATDQIPATARFHYLKLHPVTGKPVVSKLVSILIDQLVQFCLKASRYNKVRTPSEIHELHREACALLRKNNKGGEAGEVLIYFLIESILNAPQLIAKMDLKTNTNAESLGADGLHFRWDDAKKILEIYSAESKLEKTPSKAVSNLVKSLEKFHLSKTYENELRLATAHYKHADDATKKIVQDILNNKISEVSYCLRHACLVGYDWRGYTNINGSDVKARESQFRQRYTEDMPRLTELLKKHFPKAKTATNNLVLFDVFFLPFTSVQEFRTSFNEAIYREVE